MVTTDPAARIIDVSLDFEMNLPDWLALTLRIFVVVAMALSVYHSWRQAQARGTLSGTALALLTALVLFWICGFVLLVVAVAAWEITNPIAIAVAVVVCIVLAGWTGAKIGKRIVARFPGKAADHTRTAGE